MTVGRLTGETELSVLVTVTTIFIDGGPTDACQLAHPIRLKEPLGDRRVVDDTTRAVIPLADAR